MSFHSVRNRLLLISCLSYVKFFWQHNSPTKPWLLAYCMIRVQALPDKLSQSPGWCRVFQGLRHTQGWQRLTCCRLSLDRVDCGIEGAELPRTFPLVCDVLECCNCSKWRHKAKLLQWARIFLILKCIRISPSQMVHRVIVHWLPFSTARSCLLWSLTIPPTPSYYGLDTV